MGLVWADRAHNTHTLPITRQLWVAFLRSGSLMSVLCVVSFTVHVWLGCILCYLELTKFIHIYIFLSIILTTGFRSLDGRAFKQLLFIELVLYLTDFVLY